MKVCKRCKVEKPLEAFEARIRRPELLRHACIECREARGNPPKP